MPAVIIPTLNEEKGIGKVIDDFRSNGFKDIYVIDGNSTDKTAEIAKQRGAHVILQTGKGKGNAVREAFRKISADIYLLVDGDGTYSAKDAVALLKPIKEGTADMCVGIRRIGHVPLFNQIGNFLFNIFLTLAYGKRQRDILSGYRAISRNLAKSFNLPSDSFEVEAEMTVEALERRLKIVERPVNYYPRIGKTKLNPIKDGFKIGFTLVRLVRDYKPLRFFLAISAVSITAGLVFGVRVLKTFFETGTMHLTGSAIAATFFLLVGVQFFSIALLADMINRRLKVLESRN